MSEMVTMAAFRRCQAWGTGHQDFVNLYTQKNCSGSERFGKTTTQAISAGWDFVSEGGILDRRREMRLPLHRYHRTFLIQIAWVVGLRWTDHPVYSSFQTRCTIHPARVCFRLQLA